MTRENLFFFFTVDLIILVMVIVKIFHAHYEISTYTGPIVFFIVIIS